MSSGPVIGSIAILDGSFVTAGGNNGQITGNLHISNTTCSPSPCGSGLQVPPSSSQILDNNNVVPSQIYNAVKSLVAQLLQFPCNVIFDSQITTAQTFYAGVTCANSGIHNADITIDAQGNPNAIFVIQTTMFETNKHIILANGARPCNIFWIIDGDGTGNALQTSVGNVMYGNFIVTNGNMQLCGFNGVQGRIFNIACGGHIHFISGSKISSICDCLDGSESTPPTTTNPPININPTASSTVITSTKKPSSSSLISISSLLIFLMTLFAF